MATRWRRRLLRRLRFYWQLYWIGVAVLVGGTVLMCVGGYRIARSPEFLAAYRMHSVDAVYYDRDLGATEESYYRQEIRRLQGGCVLAVVGFAMLMSGVVVARYFQKAPVRVHRTKALPSLYKGVPNRKSEQPGGNP